jgi:hypothetical protein
MLTYDEFRAQLTLPVQSSGNLHKLEFKYDYAEHLNRFMIATIHFDFLFGQKSMWNRLRYILVLSNFAVRGATGIFV